jgi:ATP/maltotriose-dependent transcriptional regulator MalT/DNA-binding SARP family transcriptional activator
MPVNLILESKIKPPRNTANVFRRSRVSSTLAKALNYRLTVLQAGAGYGKSTALALLAEEYPRIIWYQVTEEDRDPFVFLSHICHATQYAFPKLEGLPIPQLESWDGTQAPLPVRNVIYQYLNAVSSGLSEPVLFMLDDVHLIIEVAEIAHLLDQLVGLAPSNLHIVISTRPTLKLPNLSRWRSLGQVLFLEQSMLAFTEAEIADLFIQHYGYNLNRTEIEELFFTTEGWAITLQLIWQSLSSGAIITVKEALARPTASLESLFDILARDVFNRLPQDIKDFMLATSVLRIMTPDICDALLESDGSETVFQYLRNQNLFIVDLEPKGLRYHPIFKQFLYQQLSDSEKMNWHSRAAKCYGTIHNWDIAIFHLLQAKDYVHAAELLNNYGGQLQEMGRLDTLANYLDDLSPEVLQKFPTLIFYMGDLARLHSRFQEALGWYQQAEVLWRERGQLDGASKALRGQARVYLDTVNPSKAEELLQQAIRISDGMVDRESRARLYELLAENKLNAGKVEEAEKLRKQAETLRVEGPSDTQLLYRVLLRTGRLLEARQQLEIKASEENVVPVQMPRAHRETQLLLSLIYSMQGEAEEALEAALEGTRRGEELASPFVTAVGYMRQGHALSLREPPEEYDNVREKFYKAIEISRALAIPRLRVEAYWGLCRIAGLVGDMEEALRFAQEGITIASRAGDEWISSLIRLSMGASYTLAYRYIAGAEWLYQAIRGFKECSDPLGVTAAQLWLSLGHFLLGDQELFAQIFNQVLEISQKRQYDFLFKNPTLLGVPDERSLVPLLIKARDVGWAGGYPEKLLRSLHLSEIEYHPGYRLYIRTLGGFQVSRGRELIHYDEWRRVKARQLFQIMITNRNAPLDRDQICELMWPAAEPETAQRNFKVALNELYRTLEPNREPGSESAYVIREGTVYGLRPSADLWLDVGVYLEKISEAQKTVKQNPERIPMLLKEALELYVGEYLPTARYDSWAASEREYLAVLFLQTVDQLCGFAYSQGEYNEVIELCQRILSQDNCWEQAYRYMMKAYDKLGERGQIGRTYQKCVEALQNEIDVSPAEETTLLFTQLTKND